MKRALVRPALAAAALAVCSAATATSPEDVSRDPVAFVRGLGQLGDGEVRNLEQGNVVAKVIDTPDRSEVLSFAATRVRTTAARLVDHVRDLEGRRQEPWTLQSGRVSDKPAPADFAGLSLDPRDVKHLPDCGINHCEIRLSAAAIGEFRKIPWPRVALPELPANALFRELLARYTASYLAGGNGALFEYVNNNDPVRIGDSLAILLQRSTVLQQLAPDLAAFLARYPQGRPRDAEDYVYWAKEKFWLLNVITLNHVTLLDRPNASGRLVVTASKQLYASHYYESSLGLTFFVEGRSGGPAYLVLLNRTRADIRRSGFTWVERTLLRHLVRRRLDARLTGLRAQLES